MDFYDRAKDSSLFLRKKTKKNFITLHFPRNKTTEIDTDHGISDLPPHDNQIKIIETQYLLRMPLICSDEYGNCFIKKKDSLE